MPNYHVYRPSGNSNNLVRLTAAPVTADTAAEAAKACAGQHQPNSSAGVLVIEEQDILFVNLIATEQERHYEAQDTTSSELIGTNEQWVV